MAPWSNLWGWSSSGRSAPTDEVNQVPTDAGPQLLHRPKVRTHVDQLTSGHVGVRGNDLRMVLPRIVHYIVSLRFRYPDMRVLISKYDYSDAYRRIAHSAEAATQTISINGNTAYLSLRLTFGGSPNPPTWCMFSELVTDLANEIGQCPSGTPKRSAALLSL
ncbi:hypothetical protein MHU86_7097 [Fragilaria crotonensis]|nr:hypothetical protein MHU86_7097 [Fragilaria crotonensis]